ncbi:hypothetical protein BDV98DRAFT_561011 [Pterulicium gracile]|uniref:Uncharacterized protein n=1 Tax=Pterulicium gracile TaxID=1884261 RepID=A0A5C3R0B1_9AGAR|nr:hypothetical protein BDV98DRAFT_561011 [Pterula gracilis]
MSSPNQHPRRLFMPLFTDNLPRTALIAFGAFLVSYYFGSYINTSSAFQVTQTVLALFAIASIILFVALHHRQEGRLFSQQQEEFLLIVGTALIGFALWIAFRQWARPTIPMAVVPAGGGGGIAGAGAPVAQVDVRSTVQAERNHGPVHGQTRREPRTVARDRWDNGYGYAPPSYACRRGDRHCVVEEYRQVYW